MSAPAIKYRAEFRQEVVKNMKGLLWSVDAIATDSGSIVVSISTYTSICNGGVFVRNTSDWKAAYEYLTTTLAQITEK